MRILALAGSMRSGSFNRKLLNVALESLRGQAEVDQLDLRGIRMQLYDGDLEASDGLPEAAREFKRRIAQATALLIVTPEYNHSIPGVLKNAIDWASRPPDNPFKGKVVQLMGASPGAMGAVRGVIATRLVLNALFAIVLPTIVQVARADQAFDDAGRLKDAKTAAQVEKACAELLRVARLIQG
jgi:chromate reductase, NAD(P)H dehydrogenase (quinone)